MISLLVQLFSNKESTSILPVPRPLASSKLGSWNRSSSHCRPLFQAGGGQDRRRWRHFIIKKPFGHSLASAKALNVRILKVLDEKQIYRIDHFLGKETVQSIMAVRFANEFFEPIWNRDHIDQVKITVAETVGVEERGRFYEQTGALRDMVPNHLFQLLAMTAMEPPVSFEAEDVRAKKADIFKAVHPLLLTD